MPKHRPYNIKIELVRGCTMRCSFCALPEMDWADGPYKFMDFEVFKKIADDISDNWPKIRVEFAERGEQTFHKDLIRCIRYMRAVVPNSQMMITSNGDTIKKFHGNDQAYVNWVNELLDSGLNIMMLDCYTKERYAHFKALFQTHTLFYEDNTHGYRYYGPDKKMILLVDGTVGENHIIRTWHNVAGSVNVEKAHAAGYQVQTITEPMHAMCVRPFREIEIHYDGLVPICCIDWKEEAVVGNVKDHSLAEIWDMLDIYREPLLRKARNEILPCSKCSARPGFRVGLESDWFEERK